MITDCTEFRRRPDLAILRRSMPLTTVDGLSCYYRLEGCEELPVVILSHSLGCDHGQWDPQMSALLAHFRVLRYDLRGHGASATPPGDCTIERLGLDVLGLADALGIARFAFCGLSLGGMIGQFVAAHAAPRVTRLVLANTSPRMANPQAIEERRRLVLAEGMAAVCEGVLGRFFTASTRAAGSAAAATVRTNLLAMDPAGYAACCAAVRDLDHRELIGSIRVPTLVIGGEYDESTPWLEHGEVLARAIPGARRLVLPTAHLSNIESPNVFNSALVDFLRG
jgi:3-oxoadipate enol-lactonase